MALPRWLLAPVALCMAASCAGCCRGPASSDGASPEPAAGRGADVHFTPEPEPARFGFKPLRGGCAEPVVRIAPGQPRPDAADSLELVRPVVADHREFATPAVQWAEADVDGARVLLARCPDADTANRLARMLREHARGIRPSPVCGYASSGWTAATRRLDVP